MLKGTPAYTQQTIQLTQPTMSSQVDSGLVMHLSRSQWFLQFLRSSQSRLGFVVALSALLASVQPLAGDKAPALVLTIVGIASAAVSVVSLIFGWLLRMVESNAAKRQFDTKVSALERERGERVPTYANEGFRENYEILERPYHDRPRSLWEGGPDSVS